jgi:hypothetical protein
MARPKKIGLDYFPMDVSFNEQIQALESLHGNNGLVWILKFWQNAYKTEHGEVDLNGLFGDLSANNSRLTTDEQQRIISTCLQLGLLIEISKGVYTSNGIRKRISAVSKDREYAVNYRKKELLGEQPPNNPQTMGESKVKESKEEKRKEETNTWRSDFKIYEKEVGEAWDKLMTDTAWLADRETYHPYIDIRKSMVKLFNDFWGVEAGWKHKKKSRSKDIDWLSTFNNALSMRCNQVPKERLKDAYGK